MTTAPDRPQLAGPLSVRLQRQQLAWLIEQSHRLGHAGPSATLRALVADAMARASREK